jgi:putative nucleotidyltransferase with HDIG domain
LHHFIKPDHVLLKQLAEKIPPTYRHGLQVGISAAFAARALRAQVGITLTAGYYHDVAKLKAPDPNIFYEVAQGARKEQSPVNNKADMDWILNHPQLSAEILQHFDFPKDVIEVVRSHHGRMKSRVKLGPAIDQGSFLYSGPLPSSPEAAIILLADSAEARIDYLKQNAEQRNFIWTRDNLTRQVLMIASEIWQEKQFKFSTLNKEQVLSAATEIVAALYVFESNRIQDPFELIGAIFNGKDP